VSSSDKAESPYQQTNLKSSEIIQAVQRFIEDGESQSVLDEAYDAYFCIEYLEDGSMILRNGLGELGDQIFNELQTVNYSDKMLYSYTETQSPDTLNSPVNLSVFYAFPTLDLQELGVHSVSPESYFGSYGGGELYFWMFVASILFAVFLAVYMGNGRLMTTVFIARAPEWSVAGFLSCALLAPPLLRLSGSLDLSANSASWALPQPGRATPSWLSGPPSFCSGLPKELRGDLIRRECISQALLLVE
jgi:hypothetical protein